MSRAITARAPRWLATALVVGVVACADPSASGEAAEARSIVGEWLAVASHRHLVRDDGSVGAWGGSLYGALGVPDALDGANPPSSVVDLGDAAAPTIATTVGTDHSCAAFEDGRVKCWGRNHLGQLGLGDTEDRGDEPGEMGDALRFVDLGSDRHAVALTAGGAFTCALFDDGAAKCWGANGDGQLGQGDTEERGDAPGEMGNALPEIDMGTGRRIIEIDAGHRFACALLDHDQVKCWGANDPNAYQLGRTSLTPIGDEPGEMGDALAEIRLGEDARVITVSSGGQHSCAVLEGGGLKCWGEGAEIDPCPHPDEMCAYPRPRLFGGRLGYGDLDTRGADPFMGDALPLVDLGQGERAVAVEASTMHTCAVLEGGRLKCWGAGDDNRLGNGGGQDIGDEPGEMGDALPYVDLGQGRTIRAFAASVYVSCALVDTDGVKCWGGTGHEREMGDALPYIELPP